MKKTFKIFTTLVFTLTVILSLYIMANGLGLVPGLDFGAGAYYYADIPEFEKYMHDGAFKASLPLWIYIALFLSWGYLMWRLLVLIETRKHK